MLEWAYVYMHGGSVYFSHPFFFFNWFCFFCVLTIVLEELILVHVHEDALGVQKRTSDPLSKGGCHHTYWCCEPSYKNSITEPLLHPRDAGFETGSHLVVLFGLLTV